MKKSNLLIVSLLLTFSTLVDTSYSYGSSTIPKDVIGVSFVENISVDSTKLKTENGRMSCISTDVYLKVKLNGCEDELGSVMTRLDYSKSEDKLLLSVAAINVNTLASKSADCIENKEVIHKINIKGKYNRSDFDLRVIEAIHN